MIVYLDSSSIVSVHLEETSRHLHVRQAIESAERTATVALAYVEVRAALARARFREAPPRLDADTYPRAVADFERDWAGYFRLNVTGGLIASAASLAEKHRLRAYDAVHLACAVLLKADGLPEGLALSTWDLNLAEAARAEGLALAHEVTS